MSREIDASEAAKALGRLGGKKGGRARAASLSPEQRSDIARRAVEARWAKAKGEDHTPLPCVTHGSEDHPLKIFNIEIQCYVLEGGIRVITNRGLQRALGMAESGGAQRLADLMERLRSKGIDVKDLTARMKQPIEFRPVRGGRSAFGYEATVLADICDAILAARKDEVLKTRREQKLAEHCETLIRGFARVGIIALIDEWTGYQEDREKQDLLRLLKAYIRHGELTQWTKRFPIDYYRELFRLLGWRFDETSSKRPRLLRILTSELIYKKLPKPVYEELKRINPPVYKGGSRKYRHHEFLTEEIGNPHLEKQIVAVTTLMRASRTWFEFKELFSRIYPASDERQLELNLSGPELDSPDASPSRAGDNKPPNKGGDRAIDVTPSESAALPGPIDDAEAESGE